MTTVLMTGASGFVGTETLRALLQRGLEVRALVRASSRTDALQAMGVPVVIGDLASGEGLREALGDVEVVLHAAGGGYARSTACFYRNNLETTRSLADAICANPGTIRHVIFLSSVSAGGPARDAQVPDEADWRRPVSHYGKSKAAAEDVLADAARRCGFALSVVRPPAIYGPGDTRLLPLFRAIARGLAPLPASARATSLLHVVDCAEALATLCALEAPEPFSCYGLSDGHVYPWPQVIGAIGAAVGTRPRRVPLPTALLYGAALASEGLGRLRGEAVLMTRDKVRDMRQAYWLCSPAALAAASGWAPTRALDEGMRETAASYRAAGWL